MDNELKELFRSVLKEELEPINKRLVVIEKDVNVIGKEVDVIRKEVDVMGKAVKDIKTGQEQLQKNIIESLGQYTERIANHVDDKTAVLNKRVYNVETEIQGLTRQ
jgi:hemerythrin-like domain-containing protein